MASPALRRGSARGSRHGPLPRAGIAASVGLAIGAAWSTLSASPGFTIGGPVVLERPSAIAGDHKDDHDGASADKSHKDRKKSAIDKAKFTTPVLSECGQPLHRPQEVAQGPPWATCFVEYEAQGRPTLEEWLMRGEQDNLNAFRSWRKAGSPEVAEPMNVRCTPASPLAVDEAMCIQCVSHSGAAAASSLRREAVVTVQGQVVSTFTDVMQCLASTTDGKGFCMSGHVVVPM